MNRRHFLSITSVTGLSLPLLTLPSCDPKESTASKATPNSDVFDLEEATISSLQSMLSAGTHTSKSLVELYLQRIADIDRSGPALNSVIELNPEALTIAERMDSERRNGKVRGPLHGIPILIKDNINTADKMMTTAGSLALEGNIAEKDAFIIAKLREAGGILLGKTNLSEWANFRSTRSTSGWSSRGGQTKNPYDLQRNPCGSSSGSGVAVSANLCAVSIGTETNGSIACPSSINGIVGMKPTVGLWSRSGIIPISHTQDTAGPMTRTVTDAAILLGALAGTDSEDKVTAESEGRRFTDYAQFLDEGGLKGKRIGVEKEFLKVHEAVDALLEAAIDQMKEAGAEIEIIELRSAIKIGGAEYELLQQEFKDGLNRYLATTKGNVRDLKQVIEFNKRNASRVMPYFQQEILESSLEKQGLGSKDYLDALEKVMSVRATINQVLKENRLVAICGPANGPSWCTDLVNGDYFTGYGMYSSAAMAGFPHITVPMGMVYGLPIGLTFLAAAYAEPELFRIAYAYEKKSGNRSSPKFN
jgi:amidase